MADFDHIKTRIEDFGKDLYTRAANTRKAKAAIAAVEYLDDEGVLSQIHAKELIQHIKPEQKNLV